MKWFPNPLKYEIKRGKTNCVIEAVRVIYADGCGGPLLPVIVSGQWARSRAG